MYNLLMILLHAIYGGTNQNREENPNATRTASHTHAHPRLFSRPFITQGETP